MRAAPLDGHSDRRTAAAAIALHGFAGVGAGLLFGLALLALDVAGIGTLLAAAEDPGLTIIFLLGAVIAFAPVVICTAVGMLSTDG